jgi:toxin ParE1/3/4
MTAVFRITPRARDELKEIGRYTLKKWGKKQRDKYLIDLDQRFKLLAQNPHFGKYLPDIEEGYYCYLQGSHVIFYFYFIRESGIDIIGLPHKAMDVVSFFR